jgi:hypothetical protein
MFVAARAFAAALLVLAALVAAPMTPASTSAATAPSADPAVPVAQPGQELIAGALADGTIDYPTSLLYRAYLMVDDPQLPPQFAGNAPAEDSTLFTEIEQAGATLPADIRQKLVPYTARPTDPRSVHSQPLAASGGPRAAFAVGDAWGRGSGADFTVQHDGDVVCQKPLDWAHLTSPKGFKVWAPCTGDYSADIHRVYDVLDELWVPETTLMGPPVADGGGPDAGGDGAIDVYLLERWQCVQRAKQCSDTNRSVKDSSGKEIRYESVLGVAIGAEPFSGPPGAQRASGYMLVARTAAMSQPSLRTTVAHELFHILGFAHNWSGAWQGSSPPSNDWLVESSAEWAGWWFVQDERSHGHSFFSWFMATAMRLVASSALGSSPLNIPSPGAQDRTYGAWVWHLFLQMETGGPGVIAKEWQAVEGKSGHAAWDDALDGVSPFATHLRDFAVRNVHEQFDPDVLKPRYGTAPGAEDGTLASMPGVTVEAVTPFPSDAFGPEKVPVDITPLGSVYFHWLFTEDIMQVKVDPSELSPTGDLDVDALVNVQGVWERRKLGTGVTRICRPTDDVSEMYLVLTNHAFTAAAQPVEGRLRLSALKDRCTGVSGTLTWTYHSDYTDPSTNLHNVYDDNITLQLEFHQRDGEWEDRGSSYSRQGSTHDTEDTGECEPYVDSSSWSSSGTFPTAATENDSTISFTLDPDAAYVSAVLVADMHGHKSWGEGQPSVSQPCFTHEEDYSQGGFEWVQMPGCGPDSDGLIGQLSEDGRTADFSCSATVTEPVNTGTQTTTWQVSGSLSVAP